MLFSTKYQKSVLQIWHKNNRIFGTIANGFSLFCLFISLFLFLVRALVIYSICWHLSNHVKIVNEFSFVVSLFVLSNNNKQLVLQYSIVSTDEIGLLSQTSSFIIIIIETRSFFLSFLFFQLLTKYIYIPCEIV